jgi:hypothetical protein
MTTQITNHPESRRYELTQDGKRAAHIAWRMHGEDTIELVHTEVEKEFEGKGLGSQIAKFALDDARARGLKVIPTCSYIAGWLQKHPDYADLAAK